jgi:predicted negative regulator of RcsB-dependent stress response
MAAFDLQEQEQIAEIKAFWETWGKWITTGVVVVALGSAGMQGWRWYQAKQAAAAAELFVQMEAAGSDSKKQIAAADRIKTEYPRTAYASRAALTVAQTAHTAGDVAAAKAQLLWVVEHSKEAGLADLARLRVAGLLLDEKQYDAALAQLAAAHDAAFDGLFLATKGDILLARNDRAGAGKAYTEALAKLAADAPSRAYVQLKSDALGGK